MTDEGVVKKVQSGEVEIFGELVKRYENKLRRYVGHIINRQGEEVEDIVQEAFIKVYENIQDFEAERKFGSWIYRITHNLCIDYFRKYRAGEKINEMEDWLESGEKLIEELAIEAETKKGVAQAIEKLDVKYKEIIVLYYFEDKSYEEISDILHIPTNNVGVLLFRAKEKLKKLYE